MRFLLENNNNISRLHVRLLIAFAPKEYLLIFTHTFVDVHLQYFCFHANLLTLAFGTTILLVDDLSVAGTFRALRVELLGHPRTKLLVHNFEAGPSTASAFLYSSGFASFAFAGFADNIFTKLQFSCFSVIKIFEGYLSEVKNIR